MAIALPAMAIQVMGDLVRGQWRVAVVGFIMAVRSAWVTIAGGIARRRLGPTPKADTNTGH